MGEVLENISIAAGCQFSIDESWEDYPITASFDNEPLYRGLKLILRNINNAVIYGAERTIRIIIYDEGTPSGKAIGHSVTIKSSQEPNQQPQPSGEATAPQPEVEVSEDSGNAENVEEQPEETAESASESNEAGAEDSSAEARAPGEGGEETTADASSKPNENTPEGSDAQAEETESTSDSSVKAENNESNEETNDN